ncbi:MAG TPA: hypothetical protein VMV15_02615 [Candidatus Binataceae bacterium]|nr:hypothetical protein [Candidatus Binataceae bacterium]
MNCFQTRKEFPNFWRRRLAPLLADELADHLQHCGLCEQAFRLFALTAPVLHSEPAAIDATVGGTDRPRPVRMRRRAAAARVAESRATVWTALSMLVAASVIAYLAAMPPRESLSEALSSSQASSSVSTVQEAPLSFFDDLAG